MASSSHYLFSSLLRRFSSLAPILSLSPSSSGGGASDGVGFGAAGMAGGRSTVGGGGVLGRPATGSHAAAGGGGGVTFLASFVFNRDRSALAVFAAVVISSASIALRARSRASISAAMRPVAASVAG